MQVYYSVIKRLGHPQELTEVWIPHAANNWTWSDVGSLLSQALSNGHKTEYANGAKAN